MEKGDYDASDLFEIKTPLHLPYFTGNAEYETLNGSIELSGVHYEFVKRKVANDTLYILCLQNRLKTRLAASGIEYQKQLTETPSAGSKKDNNPKKTEINPEYCQLQITQSDMLPGVDLFLTKCSSAPRLLTGFTTIYPQPPATAII